VSELCTRASCQSALLKYRSSFAPGGTARENTALDILQTRHADLCHTRNRHTVSTLDTRWDQQKTRVRLQVTFGIVVPGSVRIIGCELICQHFNRTASCRFVERKRKPLINTYHHSSRSARVLKTQAIVTAGSVETVNPTAPISNIIEFLPKLRQPTGAT